jgi:hypothetical protein
MDSDYQGLRSLRSLNPWLFSRHASGVQAAAESCRRHGRKVARGKRAQPLVRRPHSVGALQGRQDLRKDRSCSHWFFLTSKLSSFRVVCGLL